MKRCLAAAVLCWCPQGVATQLTRDAYETHARIALEAADLAEFRQCLARLKQLYRAGVSCGGVLTVCSELSLVHPELSSMHCKGKLQVAARQHG